MNVSDGVEHLNKLLPLKARQVALDPAVLNLHQEVLQSFVTAGRPLSRAQIAARPGAVNVDDMLSQLAADDLFVLSADRQDITGAHPFTIEERVYKVNVNGRDVYAMCALDALSITPMFDACTRILLRCHVTNTTVDVKMNTERLLLVISDDVHVGIRWQATTGCAAKSQCMEMIYLKDADTARQWQQ